MIAAERETRCQMRTLTIVICGVLSLLMLGVFALFTWVISWAGGGTLDQLLSASATVALSTLLFLAVRPTVRLIAWAQDRGKKQPPPTSGLNLVLCLLAFQAAGCGWERIDAGNVGIKIELAGTGRGVQSVPVVTGWVVYNKFTTKVLEYPTYVQTAVWSSPKAEGEPNEEMSFNSKDGLTFTGDISLSYQLNAAQVPAFYVKFRSDDLTLFTHGYLRNVARDQFNEVAGTYAPEELYGPKKEEFLRQVRDRVNAALRTEGVRLEQLGFVGAPRPPQNVVAAINAKIAATQQAMQVENEVRATQAQALKNIAQAEGEAKAKIAQAEGTATSRLKLAQAEAQANKLLAESLTPSLLQWRQLEVSGRMVERWNGQRPQVEGSGAGLLLQVPGVK